MSCYYIVNDITILVKKFLSWNRGIVYSYLFKNINNLLINGFNS